MSMVLSGKTPYLAASCSRCLLTSLHPSESVFPSCRFDLQRNAFVFTEGDRPQRFEHAALIDCVNLSHDNLRLASDFFHSDANQGGSQ